MTALVTGATGTVGSELVRLLTAERTPVRAMARSVEGLRAEHGLEPFAADFNNAARLLEAVEGIDTLVLITPAAPEAAEQASACLSVARQAGVRKVVRVSALNADLSGPTANTRLHARTETEIRKSGMEFVVLRPNFFMQNMLMAAETLKTDAMFSFANGAARMGLIDARDIASCAVHCIKSERWNGKTYDLTGPETVSFKTIAKRLSERLGKQIRYQPVAPEDAYDFAVGNGWGDWMAALLRDYGKAYSSGWGDFVTDHVQALTGQPPRSFEVFANEVLLPALDPDEITVSTG